MKSVIRLDVLCTFPSFTTCLVWFYAVVGYGLRHFRARFLFGQFSWEFFSRTHPLCDIQGNCLMNRRIIRLENPPQGQPTKQLQYLITVSINHRNPLKKHSKLIPEFRVNQGAANPPKITLYFVLLTFYNFLLFQYLFAFIFLMDNNAIFSNKKQKGIVKSEQIEMKSDFRWINRTLESFVI